MTVGQGDAVDPVLIWDLVHAKLVDIPPSPAACWLFARDVARVPEGHCFLVSVGGDRPAGAEAIARGEAISFAGALHYFQDQQAGCAAGDVPARLVAHVHAMAELDRSSRFRAERETFARQFASPTPELGLRGFLERKKERFPTRDNADLRRLIGWLARAVAEGA